MINALQLKIEDQAAVLIATQQPVARDLRELVTVFKVTDNLERAGDHAVHLAKAAIKLSGEPPFRQIDRLGQDGRDRVRHDPRRRGRLPQPGRRGGQAGRGRWTTRSTPSTSRLSMRSSSSCARGPDQVERASRLLNSSGFLERLGDHMTNICEAVVFLVEGRHVELND